MRATDRRTRSAARHAAAARLLRPLFAILVAAVAACRGADAPGNAELPHEVGAEDRDSGAVDPLVVTTPSGALRGTRTGGTLTWKGIPYAAPPTGSLRWRPPEPALPWTGVRDASSFGPMCVQQSIETGAAAGGSEDCLTLNVWAPTAAGRPASGWPVMVFIHGGGFTRGSSSDQMEGKYSYDGEALAERGPVVIVTLNYRVGALGFMAHAELAKESPRSATGDYGNLDQVAALSWVQKNIAAFGGDPSGTLLFGHSAGAYSTCELVASPLGKGLFSRAIMHSGNCNVSPRARAEAQGDAVATALGCTDPTKVLSCLRGKTADEIAGAKAPTYTEEGSFNWGPTVDGYFLPEPPDRLFSAGKHNHVSLLMGVTALEFSTLWKTFFSAIPLPTTEMEYVDDVKRVFGPSLADTLIAHYPVSAYPTPAYAIAMMASDAWFVCPNRAYARLIASHQQEPVRRFFFSHVFDSGPARPLGAGHGFDLFYVLRLFPFSWWTPSDREVALSDAMMGYWTRFAKTGDPNGGAAPPWAPYDPAVDSFLDMDTPIKSGGGLRQSQCDFLDTVH